MRQASKRISDSAEKTVRDIRRASRRHHSAEEKIHIVLEGLNSALVLELGLVAPNDLAHCRARYRQRPHDLLDGAIALILLSGHRHVCRYAVRGITPRLQTSITRFFVDIVAKCTFQMRAVLSDDAVTRRSFAKVADQQFPVAHAVALR